jgi:hypothetical protein
VTTEATPPQAQSPLSTAELAELEATLLPALERHHLRLLAHSLRSLQAIAARQPAGGLPGHDALRAWASQQPALADSPRFQAVLVEQLEAAGKQLQQLATSLGRSPMALELGDLIAAACDHRQSPSPSPSKPVSEIQSESITDALSFFRLSCGRWRSQRSSHHLLHRRAEAGGSFIEVVEIAAADPRLIAIAELHGENPAGLVGGCRVTWNASMAWDKAGEAHEGESVFGLIPTDELGRSGLLLRDRGYAETAPVAGHFAMDERDGLLLTTGYETMASLERFSFAGPNVRLRTSTVEGLSNTASFCVETRLLDSPQPGAKTPAQEPVSEQPLSPLGW